ncbi:Heavy metal-associated isoprenylated plant protein 26 [Apostasia shenzhenica]|uniref:Heavy metal-associated isoprenylated plant protein 26 n=1 Tax=Apostasia shenzhenica TaxID=1088818 RepID=A0A2I0AY89_9ASPA|nr:Heavy metal-associated isoprenylated plant protein 26 [Apostasia shenzhenica]
MRANKMGLLCRSQAATAACVPGNVRSTVVAPRTVSEHILLQEPKYTRLADRRFRPPAGTSAVGELHRQRRNAVTLSMVTKKEKDRPKPAKPTPVASAAASLSSSNGNNHFQVVVMRVSIHCQGCAGKVRKHISKMEGVTSFSIDLETKRVTVMGHVSPVGVLESISKVKKAEFWPC